MIRKVISLSWLLSVLALPLSSITAAQTPSWAQTPTTPQQPSTQNAPGAAPNPASAPNQGAPGSGDDLSYRIGPGDELDVRVFGRAELSRTVRVDNYGKIRLPFLPEMQAACHTEAKLAGLVAEGYKKFLRDPQVDVLGREYRSQPVPAIGAENNPGPFQFHRQAGGPDL